MNVLEARGQEFVDTLNLSLSSGVFPDNSKVSTLTSIRKVSNSNNTSDFRPSNQLPMFEEVLELIIKQQLEDFLENNGIFNKEQSSFRAKYSCETALRLVLDE